MTPEERAAVGRASDQLSLLTIELCRAEFERPASIPPGAKQIAQQHKRGTAFAVAEALDAEGHAFQVFQVRVHCGTRGLNDATLDEPIVFFEIEADFVATYRLDKMPDEEALKAFAEFNAVHHIWPFWRQHVFDIVHRSNLPNLEIPLLAGPQK